MRDPREVLSRSAPPPDLTVSYGRHPDQVIDVRLPERGTGGGNAGVLVVVIHGGFWRKEYDRRHTDPMTSALAAAGHPVAIPEFRRTGQRGGGWPGTFDDVAAAFDALPDLIGDRVDTGTVVLVGHSAGGHLALWTAGRHRLAAASPWRRPAESMPAVAGVVGLAPVADLELCRIWHLGDGAVEALLDGTPRTYPTRYASTDPGRLVPLGVPASLVHGTEDDVVPVAMSRRYAERARSAGDSVELIELAGIEHFGVIDPLSEAWPRVLAAIATYDAGP